MHHIPPMGHPCVSLCNIFPPCLLAYYTLLPSSPDPSTLHPVIPHLTSSPSSYTSCRKKIQMFYFYIFFYFFIFFITIVFYNFFLFKRCTQISHLRDNKVLLYCIVCVFRRQRSQTAILKAFHLQEPINSKKVDDETKAKIKGTVSRLTYKLTKFIIC